MKLHLVVFISLLSLLTVPFVSHADMSSAKYSISGDSISGIEVTDNLDNGKLTQVKGDSNLSNQTGLINFFEYKFQILIIIIVLVAIFFSFLRFRKRRI